LEHGVIDSMLPDLLTRSIGYDDTRILEFLLKNFKNVREYESIVTEEVSMYCKMDHYKVVMDYYNYKVTAKHVMTAVKSGCFNLYKALIKNYRTPADDSLHLDYVKICCESGYTEMGKYFISKREMKYYDAYVLCKRNSNNVLARYLGYDEDIPPDTQPYPEIYTLKHLSKHAANGNTDLVIKILQDPRIHPKQDDFLAIKLAMENGYTETARYIGLHPEVKMWLMKK